MTSESAFERPVFAVSGRTFGWGDIVYAATAWGRWAECERAARAGRSALLRAQRSGIALTGGEFEAAEERFRRERRLLAADELVSWLARRDVEVSEWRDYIRGVVLRRRGDDSTPLDDPGSGSDFGAAVWAYAICSCTLDSVAYDLAARAAVADALGRLGETRDSLTESELEELDRLFTEFCDRAANADAIEREVERHRLDWLALEWRSQVATDPEVLREAALCIREDGLGFDEVAATAGLVVERRRAALDSIDAELRPHLLGARAGELLGPLSVGGAYSLVEVLDKRTPSSDDPEVRALARGGVVSRAVEAEVVDRVRWHERV